MSKVAKNEMRDTLQHSRSPVLEARDIVKELGSGAGMVRAVKGVDISLVPGELTLLMGPSGSGKTTLLSILGCILAPTSGTVVINGTLAGNLAPEALAKLRRTHIGYIFQSYNLFPTLNAMENVRIALDVAGVGGNQAIRQAEQALRDVGLGHRLHSYPANLSGGEKQRVAVARAIASAPSIVLADEPTAALDSENGHAVMRLLADIALTQNRAILVVTHDPRTLMYADRIIKIEDGVIVSVERHERGAIASSERGKDGSAPPKVAKSDHSKELHVERAPDGVLANSDGAFPALETSHDVRINAGVVAPDVGSPDPVNGHNPEPTAKRRRKNVDQRQIKAMQPEDLTAMIQKRKTNA
jgi:putative ABC transport system ATP-binding protein